MGFFKDMFKDDNDINEKSVVGFGSFGIAEAGKIFGKKGNENE